MLYAELFGYSNAISVHSRSALPVSVMLYPLHESENIMSDWLASQIKVNEEAGVDPDELKAILRFLDKIPAVVRDYAKGHDSDETLQWLKALYNLSKLLGSVSGHSAEAVLEQLQAAIRSGNLPVFSAQSALGSAPAAPQQQPAEPPVVSNLLNYLRNILAYAGVDVNGGETLDLSTIPALAAKAQKKREEFDTELSKVIKERDQYKNDLEASTKAPADVIDKKAESKFLLEAVAKVEVAQEAHENAAFLERKSKTGRALEQARDELLKTLKERGDEFAK